MGVSSQRFPFTKKQLSQILRRNLFPSESERRFVQEKREPLCTFLDHPSGYRLHLGHLVTRSSHSFCITEPLYLDSGELIKCVLAMGGLILRGPEQILHVELCTVS